MVVVVVVVGGVVVVGAAVVGGAVVGGAVVGAVVVVAAMVVAVVVVGGPVVVGAAVVGGAVVGGAVVVGGPLVVGAVGAGSTSTSVELRSSAGVPSRATKLTTTEMSQLPACTAATVTDDPSGPVSGPPGEHAPVAAPAGVAHRPAGAVREGHGCREDADRRLARH